MKSIPLTQGYSAIVSDEDYERVSALGWYAVVAKGEYVYACRSDKGYRVYLHRFLAGQDGLVVDHINGDTLDNRRENLRAVTHGENTANQHKPTRSNSGVRNVYRNHRGRFLAKVVREGKQHFLGSYRTVEEAAAAIASYTRSAA